jgi:hypothetical protein
MKKLAYLLFLTLIVGVSSVASAQTKPTKKEKAAAKAAEVKQWIDQKNYLFVAQYAQPLGGGNIYVQPNYDLKIANDSVTAFLPFFGRAFTAPINPSEGGIKFTSTKYDYQAKQDKKGMWNILIKPADTRDVRQLRLSVSPGGYATLNIINTNRTPISFTGYVEEVKASKAK